MKSKTIAVLAVATMVMVGTMMVRAQSEAKPAAPQPDPRINQLLEQNKTLLQQNEQILKNQAEIQQKLDGIKQDLLQVRRRGS